VSTTPRSRPASTVARRRTLTTSRPLWSCSEHGPIFHLFELILVTHANTSNGTNHII
jgi:hypothetical protein